MNFIKKITAVLCVVFLLPVNSVFTAECADVTENISQIYIEDIKIDKNKKGDIIEIPVNIENNQGFASTGFSITYSDNIKLTDTKGGIIERPIFYIDGNTASITSSSEKNLKEDGVLFTLCFTLQKDISSDEKADISLQKLVFSSLNGKDVETEIKNPTITFEIKQEIEPTTEKIIETTSQDEKYDYLGDINRDKKVDSKDAVKILIAYAKSIVGIKPEISIEDADINSDGRIDSKDAVFVLKYYAQTIVSDDTISLREYMKDYV